MNLGVLAGRNLFRKRKRLLITVGAMGAAGALVIFYNSLMLGFNASMISTMIENEAGHIQIHAMGYRSDPDLYTSIPKTDEFLAEAKSLGYEATPRSYAFGLIAAKDASAGAELWGMDPIREPLTTRLPSQLREGSWLNEADPRGAVIGGRLAKKLDVNVGSELVFLSQASDGSMANEIYTVKGILKPVSARADDAGVLISLSAFRKVMALDEQAHEIVVVLPDSQIDMEESVKKLSTVDPTMEVLSWKKLTPVIDKMVQSQEVGLWVMMIIAYIAVGMVVFNAMIMNVFERISEFGVMKAVGVKPWQVFTIIAIEALIESLLACVLAAAIGIPAAFYFETHGLDLRSFSDSFTFSGLSFEPIMYAAVSAKAVVPPLIFLFVLSGLAVIYPALKAALIRPVKAIYHR